MIKLTARRVDRLLVLCRTPSTASRASERLYKLSQRCTWPRDRSALLWLSNAMNEHKHAILSGWLGREDLAAEHASDRDEQIRWALRGST